MNQSTNIRTRGSSSPIQAEDKKITEGDGWDQYVDHTPPSNVKEMEALIDELSEEKQSDAEFDMWEHPKLQGFLSFVQSKIKEMEEYARISHDILNLSFTDVNVSLAQHYSIYLSLLSLYNIAVMELERANVKYQQWFDEKYLDIRKRENKPSLSAQKWLSQKEIEAMVRVENKKEYQKEKALLIASERQTAFLRRLRDSWDGHRFSLQTLSKNLQAEYAGTPTAESSSWG